MSCACCGDGRGEVKCPLSLENCDFENYCKRDSSCLEMKEGNFYLKRSHNYFYQVQQQLSTSHRTKMILLSVHLIVMVKQFLSLKDCIQTLITGGKLCQN